MLSLFLALAQFISGPGGGALPPAPPPPIFALVNHAAAAGINSATTSAVNMTGANLIVMSCNGGNGIAPVCTDSNSNTWHTLNANIGGSSFTNQLVYCAPCTVSVGQTFTQAGLASNGGVCVMGFSGAASSSPLDRQGGDPGNTVTSTITPSVAGALVVTGLVMNYGTSITSVNSPFTATDILPFSGGVSASLSCGYVIQTSAVAAQATWNPTGQVGANSIASFLP